MEELVIVEVKAVEAIAPVHKKQLLTYLKVADKRVGLIQNAIMERIRLVLLVDYALVRESLSRQLQLEPEFEIVGECGTAVEGLAALERTPADVVLLDYDAAGDQTAQFIAAAREGGYQGRFLVLASERHAADLFLPLQAGASGVFRNSPLDSLPRAIRQVAAGEAWIDLETLHILAGPKAEREKHNLDALLTKREQEVLGGVLEGLTNKAIAERLGVSEGATKSTLREIFRKTGVHRRSQLVRMALAG